MDCLNRPYYFKFLQGCLPQLLFSSFLIILSYTEQIKSFFLFVAVERFLEIPPQRVFTNYFTVYAVACDDSLFLTFSKVMFSVFRICWFSESIENSCTFGFFCQSDFMFLYCVVFFKPILIFLTSVLQKMVLCTNALFSIGFDFEKNFKKMTGV